MSYDTNDLLNQKYNESTDSKTLKPEKGDYAARIIGIEYKSFDKRDGGKLHKLNLKISLEDSKLLEQFGRFPVIFHDLFLDVKEDGRLDNGKGKNIALGKLREATNTNSVKDFSLADLDGKSFMVRIIDDPKDDSRMKVKGVSRLSKPEEDLPF